MPSKAQKAKNGHFHFFKPAHHELCWPEDYVPTVAVRIGNVNERMPTLRSPAVARGLAADRHHRWHLPTSTKDRPNRTPGDNRVCIDFRPLIAGLHPALIGDVMKSSSSDFLAVPAA